jgi:hypothetical protein
MADGKDAGSATACTIMGFEPFRTVMRNAPIRFRNHL